MFCVPRRPIYSIISSDNPLEKNILANYGLFTLSSQLSTYVPLASDFTLVSELERGFCLLEISFSFWVVKYQRADPRDEGYGYWNNEKKFHAGAENFTHTTEEVVV